MPVVRVDIALRKGAEEALDAEFYALSGGIWVEEQGASVKEDGRQRHFIHRIAIVRNVR